MPSRTHPQQTDSQCRVSPHGCSEEGGRSHGCSCQFALWSSERSWGQGRLRPIKNTTKLTADYFKTLNPIRCTRQRGTVPGGCLGSGQSCVCLWVYIHHDDPQWRDPEDLWTPHTSPRLQQHSPPSWWRDALEHKRSWTSRFCCSDIFKLWQQTDRHGQQLDITNKVWLAWLALKQSWDSGRHNPPFVGLKYNIRMLLPLSHSIFFLHTELNIWKLVLKYDMHY